MKKTIVLLAGYPATGKSYLCNKILERLPDFVVVSQDEIKEKLFDQYGFDNMEEKVQIENQSWTKYYERMEECLKNGTSIISDYPFSDKQKGRISDLSEKYGYQVVTFRLIGDLDVLYERSRKRDLAPSRHLSHLVSKYHKGDVLEDRTKADCLVTYEIFMDRCQNRGYGTFELGHLIELDVTDYTKIDYPAIIQQLCKLVEE
ncbi:MAG: AAA family ATPase [Lachnospiraceae bacterium]|nr:AAA family ATPase [Lachnospiraceae bacterium]